MKRYIIPMLLCLMVQLNAQDASRRSEMVDEMQTAVNTVALKYGNIPFTQIFTNEPTRAAAVKKRFMEFERMDSLHKQISELETKAEKLNDEIQAKEAFAADLDRRVTARGLELQSAAAEAANRTNPGNTGEGASEAKKN